MSVKNLPTPPKFGPENPGPMTLADWVQFYRWLLSMWRVTKDNIAAPESITIGSQASQPSHGVDIAAVRAASSAPGHLPLESAPSPLIRPVSAPPSKEIDQAAVFHPLTSRAPQNELSGLLVEALQKVPYPQRQQVVLIEDTHAHRANYPAATYPNSFYFETSKTTPDTDRTLLYASVAGQWEYVSGICQCTQATLPAGLGTHDAGVLANVTDYGHILQWTGAAWEWGPGETGSGSIQGFLIDPAGSGWHLCDGTAAVPYLKADGTTGTITLPDLTSAAGKAAYAKLGSPATLTANAAVAPGFTGGAGGNTGATSAGTPAGAIAATGTAAVNVTPSGATQVAAEAHAHTFTGSVLGTHTHTIGAAAGTVDNTGEPQNIVLRPYFRQ